MLFHGLELLTPDEKKDIIFLPVWKVSVRKERYNVYVSSMKTMDDVHEDMYFFLNV